MTIGQQQLICCPICEHSYRPSETNKHHLVPRSRKGRITVPLCRTCHKQIHAIFSEKELERHYDTIEKLLAAEELASWIAWVRRRKPTAHIKVSRSKRRRR